MKKVLFTIVLIITLHITLYAQLQSIGVYRIADTTTAFGRVIPQGTILIDKATGDGYLLVSNATATESISSLVIGSNYRKLLSYILPTIKYQALMLIFWIVMMQVIFKLQEVMIII